MQNTSHSMLGEGASCCLCSFLFALSLSSCSNEPHLRAPERGGQWNTMGSQRSLCLPSLHCSGPFRLRAWAAEARAGSCLPQAGFAGAASPQDGHRVRGNNQDREGRSKGKVPSRQGNRQGSEQTLAAPSLGMSPRGGDAREQTGSSLSCLFLVIPILCFVSFLGPGSAQASEADPELQDSWRHNERYRPLLLCVGGWQKGPEAAARDAPATVTVCTSRFSIAFPRSVSQHRQPHPAGRHRCSVSPPASMELANSKDFQWKTLAPLPSRRVYSTLVEAGGQVFAIGGCDDNGVPMDCFEVYSPEADQWTSLPPMPTARAGVAVATLGKRIMVIGGVGVNQLPVKIVEMYNTDEGKWKKRNSLREAAMGISVTAKGKEHPNSCCVLPGQAGVPVGGEMEKGSHRLVHQALKLSCLLQLVCRRCWENRNDAAG